MLFHKVAHPVSLHFLPFTLYFSSHNKIWEFQPCFLCILLPVFSSCIICDSHPSFPRLSLASSSSLPLPHIVLPPSFSLSVSLFDSNFPSHFLLPELHSLFSLSFFAALRFLFFPLGLRQRGRWIKTKATVVLRKGKWQQCTVDWCRMVDFSHLVYFFLGGALSICIPPTYWWDEYV